MTRRVRGVAILIATALTAGILLPVLSAAPVRPREIPPQRRPVSFQDRLLPAPADGGFRQPGYWVWCGTVVQGTDGKYHHGNLTAETRGAPGRADRRRGGRLARRPLATVR